MAKEGPWRPGDGAEQQDASPAAQEARVGTRHFTPEHRSDEPDADGFDPSYSEWRRRNGDRLDADYRRWRAQTGQPFSDTFLEWAAEEARRQGL